MQDLDLTGEDVNAILDVLVPGKIAMSHGMSEQEAAVLLQAVLPIIERVMPPELQAQDKRVIAAKELWQRVRHHLTIPIIGVAH